MMCGVSENPPDIDSTVTPQTYFNDIWRSGDGGLTWDCLHTAAPFSVRAFASAAVITVSGQERIYVIGGEYDEETDEGVYETLYRNDCFYSADGGETWSTGTIPSGWSARSRHALTAITSSMMLLSGGRDASTVYNSVHTFDGTSWSEGGALASPRFGHAQCARTISSTTTIFVIGGASSAGTLITGDSMVVRSTNSGGSWSDATGVPSQWSLGIIGASAVVATSSQHVYVIGGYNSLSSTLSVSYFNDVWWFGSSSWSTLTPHARWSGRQYHTTVRRIVDGVHHLILLGGQIHAGRHGAEPIAANDIWSIVANTTLNGIWNQVSNLEFMSGRSSFGVAVVNSNDIVITGGWETGATEGSRLNDVWRSNDGGRNFYRVETTSVFSGRHQHAVATVGTNIYLSGGHMDGHEVWMSDDIGTSWTRLKNATTNFSAVQRHAMVAIGERLFVLGGRISNVATNQIWTSIGGSNPLGQTWVQLANPSWSARETFGCVTHDSNIYVIGGWTGSTSLSDVWRGTFNSGTTTITWVSLTSLPQPVMQHSASVRVVDGTRYIYVLGGGASTSVFESYAWYLTDDAGSWVDVSTSTAWAPRRAHRSVVVDDRLVLIGGATLHPGTTIRVNEVWYSTSATLGSWFVEAPNAKAGRYGSDMVRLQSSNAVLLMGGFNGGSTMNDIWQSVDEGRTWALVVEHAEWSPRMEHIAEQRSQGHPVIFGGVNATGFLNDVWISHTSPIGESWEQISVSGPSARAEHASVKVKEAGRDAILICGGRNESYLNDTWILQWTGIYSSNDECSWTHITSSPWAPRSQHALCSITDDSYLLIGGTNGESYFNDVWKLTLVGPLSSWILLVPSAPWDPRASHSVTQLDDGVLFLVGGTDGEHLKSDLWRCDDSVGIRWTNSTASLSSSDEMPSVRRDHSAVAIGSGLLVVDGISEGRILNDSWITAFGWSRTSALTFQRRTDVDRLDLGEREGGRVASDCIRIIRSPIGEISTSIGAGQVMWLGRLRSKWDENLKSTIVARLRVNKAHFDRDFTLVARFTNNTSYLIGPSSSVQNTSLTTIQRGASVAQQSIPTSAEDEDAYVLVQEGVFTVSVSGVIITTTAVAMTGPDSAMSGTKYVEIGIRNESAMDLLVTTPLGETILEIQSISPPRWAGVAPIPRESTSSTYTAVAKLESPTNELDAPMIYHSRNSTMKFQYRDVVVASGVSPSYSTYADWISALDARSTFKHIIYSEITIYSPVSTFSVNPLSPRYFEFNRIGADGTTRTISEHYYANGYGGRTFPIPSGESVSGSYVFTQRSVMENVAGQQARLLITSGFQGDSSDGTNILNSIISFNPNLSGFAGGDPHVWSLNGVYTLPTRPMVISFLDTLDALGKHARLGINCTAEPLSMSQIAASCASAARPDKMAQELRTMTFWGTIFVFRKEGKRTAMVAIHAETLHILFAKGDVYVYGTDAADVSDALIRIGQAKRVPDMPDSRCPTARIASSTALARTIMFPRVIDRVAPLCFTLSADPISCPYDRSSIELAFDLSMRSGLVMNTTEIRACHGAIIGPDSYDTLSSLFDIRPIEQIRASRRRVPDRWTVCDETGKHIRVDTPSRPVFTQ